MTLDRGTTKTLNAVCGTAALLAIFGVGFVVYRAKGTERPQIGNPRLQEARRRAAVAERVGDLRVAEREYRIALGLEPKSGSLRLGLARVLMARGDRNEAYTEYRTLVGSTLREGQAMGWSAPKVPGGADTLAWYGDLARARGDIATATRAYERATQSVDFWYPMDGALLPFERPVDLALPKLDALAFRAHLNAGRSLGVYVVPRNGERHVRRALSLVPNSLQARLLLAYGAFGARRNDEGFAMLEEARRVGRPGQAGWSAVGRLLAEKGRREAGLAMLRQAEDALPRDRLEAWLALASLYSALRSPRERVALDRAWAAVPTGNAESWASLAWATQRVDPNRAKEAMRRALASAPKRDAMRTIGLASSAFGLGLRKEAVAVLQVTLPFAGRAERAVRDQIRFYSQAPNSVRVIGPGGPGVGFPGPFGGPYGGPGMPPPGAPPMGTPPMGSGPSGSGRIGVHS